MNRKKQFMSDIANGMLYIQNSPIQYHGRLTTTTCLIDKQFRIKLTNFGYIPTKQYKQNFYTAPEYINDCHNDSESGDGSKKQLVRNIKGDVYSFAIIAHELLYDNYTFFRDDDEFDELSDDEKMVVIRKEFNKGRPFRGLGRDLDLGLRNWLFPTQNNPKIVF